MKPWFEACARDLLDWVGELVNGRAPDKRYK